MAAGCSLATLCRSLSYHSVWPCKSAAKKQLTKLISFGRKALRGVRSECGLTRFSGPITLLLVTYVRSNDNRARWRSQTILPRGLVTLLDPCPACFEPPGEFRTTIQHFGHCVPVAVSAKIANVGVNAWPHTGQFISSSFGLPLHNTNEALWP